MRKDLVFRYINSAITNLNRVHMHLLDQDNNGNFVTTSETNNRIEKEFQSANLTQVEIDFLDSQLENIMFNIKLVKEDLKNLNNK